MFAEPDLATRLRAHAVALTPVFRRITPLLRALRGDSLNCWARSGWLLLRAAGLSTTAPDGLALKVIQADRLR